MVESNSNRFRDPSVFKTELDPVQLTLHIETHSRNRTCHLVQQGYTNKPLAIDLNVFLYGWGTLNRTRTYGFKVRSTTTMLYPNKLQQIFKEQCVLYTRFDDLSTTVLY